MELSDKELLEIVTEIYELGIARGRDAEFVESIYLEMYDMEDPHFSTKQRQWIEDLQDRYMMEKLPK